MNKNEEKEKPKKIMQKLQHKKVNLKFNEIKKI